MKHDLRSMLTAVLLVLVLGLSGGAGAQGRGGPPGGLPAGLPQGLPAGGPLGGPVGGPGAASLPGGPLLHGVPAWVGTRAPAAAAALDHVQAALERKLAPPQQDRAAALARARPGQYDLDRNGAAIVRGEVLATGLDEPALARLERAGFTVERREPLPELDLGLAVISRAGSSAADVLKQLQRREPDGLYAMNHVLFGSGAAGGGTAAGWPGAAGRGGDPVRVGLIDTAVSPLVEAPRRVRLIQQPFVAGPVHPELHGTAVASLLARGPEPVEIHAGVIFSDARAGSSDLLIRALGWLARDRVPVINVSMVGPANPIVAMVVAAMLHKGFTIVAPVGNDGAVARPLYPASYPGVVAVSAVGPDGRLLPEASRVGRVDFLAPGIATVVDPAGRAAVVRGTSFAAPLVSRLLADRIAAPDPRQARAALAALAGLARPPAQDRRWAGHGQVPAP